MIQPLSSKSQRKAKTLKWIRNCVDYSGERERKPYTFYRDASLYDCLLPSMVDMQPNLLNLYKRSVLDEDMKSDLEDSHSINWFTQAIVLFPVCVPKDGNCLLHAASMAVWGVEDSQNTLRDLMLMTVQNNDNFKNRWWSQLVRSLQSLDINQPEVIDNEWDDVIRSISDLGSSTLSVAVPHRFLEGVHIYILANILRRPIIVITSGPAKSLTGDELQKNNIGGLYLPLEWPSIECCKTPIILGYSYNHFCPLISETPSNFLASQKKREHPLVFPLVHSDLSFLLVRFLKEEEEPAAWHLVQSYLLVKEFDIVENTGTVTKAPFAQMQIRPLQPEQNALFEHLTLLKTRLMESEFLKASRRYSYNTLGTAQQSSHPFYDIEISSQTEVVPMSTIKDKNKNVQDPQNRNSPLHKYIQEMNQNTPSQCIFEGCSKEGNPALEYLCHDCFRILAAEKSSALCEGQLLLNSTKNPTAPEENFGILTSAANFNRDEGNAVIPTAPLMSLEPQNNQLLSMMAQRCINNCGYRCSSKTYPYCHECSQIEMEKTKGLKQSIATSSKPYEVTEKALGEFRNKIKERLVEGITGHATSSEHSWLQENEDHNHFLSNASDKLHKSRLEIMAGQNCKNFEYCSGQKMLDHNLCFCCAEDKKGVKINSKQFQMEPNPWKVPDKSDRFKEKAIVNHTEQKYEEIAEQIIEGFAESLAGTDITSSGDIEVSEEPLCRVKCTSPYCEIYVLPPEKLCDNCKDILKNGYEQSQEHLKKSGHVAVSRFTADQLEKEKLLQKEKTKPKPDFKHLESVPKGKHCIVASCPNYGDPQMNNMCSSCYFKSNPSAKPQATMKPSKKSDRLTGASSQAVAEQMPSKEVVQHKKYSYSTQQRNSTSPLHGKGMLDSRSAEAQICKEPAHVYPASPVHHKNHQLITKSGLESSIFSQMPSSFSQPEPKSLIVTSKTGHITCESLHQLPLDSSYSFNQTAEQNFEKMFQGIEKTWKSSAKKCNSIKCENYGNKATKGYCNACFKVIRRQRILEREAHWGEDVPDSEVLVPDSEVLVPDSEVLVPDSEVLVPDSEVLVPDSEVLVPDSEHLVPDSDVLKSV